MSGPFFLHSNGFTLIELLLVTGVITLLASMGAVAWTAVAKRSRVQGTATVVHAVATAIERHPRQRLPLSVGPGGQTRLVPAWDLNQDGWLDADPSADPAAPLDATAREFTAAERNAAAAVGYRGLLMENPDLALPRRHVGADGRILDGWGQPLRIEWAGPDSGRFSGRPVGIWSLGPNRQDDAAQGDDLTSWR